MCVFNLNIFFLFFFSIKCRQRRISYTGPLIVTLGWSIDGVKQEAIPKYLGDVPVMVKVCDIPVFP